MQKLPLELDAAKLKEIAPERLQGQSVAAVLLALGSNYQAKYYFPRVHKSLAALGEIQITTAFQNPDFTATLEHPKPDYTNQCVYLSLTDSTTLQQLQKIFKSFEGDCNRQRPIEPATIRQVTMDIDILLIKLDSKNNNCSDEWMIMADRYPFKAHESAGIVELVESSL